MSTQCRQFVQNAWKKERCSNCFKSREEHASPASTETRPLISRASNGAAVKRPAHKVQGILREANTIGGQVRSKRKNVAFPDSLTEIIGYDGGDDGSDPSDGYDAADDEADSSSSSSLGVDELPDSEEERALGNLTRANTNFNTVTANLSSPPASASESRSPRCDAGPESNGSIVSSPAKGLSSLMLGRTRKDADGRKTTLLVSVKPFGAEDAAVPTARRPSDKKSPEQTKPKASGEISSDTKAADPSIVKATRCIVEEKPSEAKTAKSITSSATASSSLGKIVDMPLITSTNIVSVMHEDGAQSSLDSQKSADQKKATNINRTPAIKKPESEKPRVVQNFDQSAAKNHKNHEISNSVDVNSSSKASGNQLVTSKSDFSKDSSKLTDLTERKVEGEATAKPAYRFAESRESAGEPDGKADEEVIAEPPALPKSPPPCAEQPCLRDKRQSQSGEARASFLHSVNSEPAAQKPTSTTQARPTVPSKPTSLPSMPRSSAPSLASLLSESRAYEYRLLNQASTATQAELDRSRESRSSGGNQTEEDTSIGDQHRGDDEGDESEASLSEQPRSNKRRQAPQPPTSLNASANSAAEPDSLVSSSGSLFARNPVSPLKTSSDHCPVVREKEKRERASSCSPKPRKAVSSEPDPSGACSSQQYERPASNSPPEPAPRRNISLSQDSLAAAAIASSPVALYAESAGDEKKKHRSKFSLKKFLRMGSRKDVDMTCMRCDEIPSTPQPKPKLEIIHPLELDGADVQVVRNEKSDGATATETKNDCPTSSPTSHFGPPHVTVRPSKPPPPPRAQSLDESSRSSARSSTNKTAQPQQQEQSSSTGKPVTSKSWQPNSGSSASDSIYANLGAAAAEDVAGATRSALAPAKPRRTSSMRDQTPLQISCSSQKHSLACNGSSSAPPSSTKGSPGAHETRPAKPNVNGKTAYDSSVSSESQSSDRHSSASECNNPSLELRQQSISGSGGGSHLISKRQSDSGTLDSNSKHIKFQQNLFTRSTSLPYCASESDSEIYSPFGYCNGDEGSEDSCDRSDCDSGPQRLGLSHHQRHKRARSIVHRSLEDNYGAVIVANHESLSQLLERERAQPAPISPQGLRALKSTPKEPRLDDFTLDLASVLSVGRGKWLFVQSAVWAEQKLPCSLCASVGPTRPASGAGPGRAEFRLEPIVEFGDDLPEKIVQLLPQQIASTGTICRRSVEATISVLPRVQVNTLASFANSVGSSSPHQDAEATSRESSFVLLQLVSALKSLQARGIEEAPADLGNVVLCREDKQTHHRLYFLQGLNVDSCESDQVEYASLCQCALNGLEQLGLAKKLPLVRELLVREKAVTLSQVKSVLEFSLWGPADAVGLGGPRERETALQRWLDLERATLLQALVRAPRAAQLELADEYQLLFLVRTSAKIMCEASLLLDRQRSGLPFSCGGMRPAGSRPPAV